ncbi:MAG: T9SS type A sorting domain-containing protein [Bacteroidetes bacterium]|nr:T9SS type A sorting domain-containing protein [Bacteroidota bacterium]
MKKLIFTLVLASIALISFSQQVARDKVILEIATGTWCQYCPGAAMGADDLVANGHDVAVIEYHYSDPYANTASNYRNSYYSVSAYPTANFDGTLTYEGGSQTQSMYSQYLPLYNQRIVIPSSFIVDIYGENTGLTYDITLVIEKVASTTSTNLTAQLVLTESEIAYSWWGMTECNFVERLMVPDHFGTSLDFSGGDEIILNLQFTMNTSWVTDHCELVAFVQDENSKEIMQGTKVALNNLQPMPATAYFSCSDSSTCETGSIQFYDNSLGNIISWDWTFEGGTPPTSGTQNPVVTYNINGTYDVELIVSDGTVTDTLLQSDMILVKTIPAQANTPSGSTNTCEGRSYQYTTNSVTYASSYTWAVEPTDAGTMTGNDTVGTFNAASGWTGNYTVKVRAENECGNGIWSQGFQATLHSVPVAYTLSNGGGYCEGGTGIELTLDGSEIDVDYELYLDGVATGNIVAGTGSAISFGYQTDECIYTAKGFNDNCSENMIGNAWIYLIYPPQQASAPTGPVEICNNSDDTQYITAGATNADTYIWTLTPPEAGIITGTGLEATVDWDESYSGSSFISVEGENECFTGPPSDELEVTVFESPNPEISGLTLVCNEEIAVYSTNDNPGNTYAWNVTGGTIIAGAGTHEITIQWGTPGTGYVNVTEENSDGCSETTEDYQVTIDDCTRINELSSEQIRIYPNPAKNYITIEFVLNKESSYQLSLLNQIGNVVYQLKETRSFGKQITRVNISNLPEGFYTIQFRMEDGYTIQDKFVKVK